MYQGKSNLTEERLAREDSPASEIYPDSEERDFGGPRGITIADFSHKEVMEEFRKRVVADAPTEVLLAEIVKRNVPADETVFKRMQETSAARSERWMAGSVGFTVLERAAELAGEAGELVNVVKKIRREQVGVVGNTPADYGALLYDKAEREAGDVFITLLNLANDLGLDLLQGIKNAFNDKSKQLGFPERF